LRAKHPELHRPYKAPFIKIGAPLSAIIYIIMMTQLDMGAFLSGLIWCVLGLIIYYCCQNRYGKSANQELNSNITKISIPDDTEKAKMDREYKIWCVIVALAVVAAIGLYVVPYFMT